MNIINVNSATEIPAAKLIGLDIETSPYPQFLKDNADVPPDPRLHRMVLAQVCVGDNVYILHDNFESLNPILEDPRVVKVIHNASFESKHFLWHTKARVKNTFDTFLVEGVLESGHNPELSLEAISKKYLDISLNKKIRDKFVEGDTLTDDMVEYAALDAWVLPQLHKCLTSEIEQVDYAHLDKVLKLEHMLLDVVTSMELDGIDFDVPKWLELATIAKQELVQVRAELLRMLPSPSGAKRISIFGDESADINLNSKDTVLKMMQKAGVEIEDLRNTTVAEVVAYNPHPLLQLYAKYAKLQKAVTTYGEKFLENVNPVTGRIHPRVKQIETRTGRFSGSNPNLMNIPKDPRYRACFKAPDGYKLIGCDYSQQELRILAEYSQDRGMIEAFEKGIDFHVHVARILFKDPTIDEKHPKRKVAKNLNFGLIYGMGAKKLAKALKTSVSEAKELMNAHGENFPGAFNWMQATIELARTHGYVETLIGRRRYLDTQMQFETQARNSPIQGSAADQIKISLVMLKKKGIKVVNVVHDEILIESKDENVEEEKELLEKTMIKAALKIVKHVPFEADAYVGQFWNKG